MTLDSILQGLNDSQKEAVTHIEEPILVVAGPGTGKTLTIARRITYILSKGVLPEEILAITFTNRAAKEMKERTELYCGEAIRGIFIGTFHAFGMELIRRLSDINYRLIGRDEQIEILKNLLGGSEKDAQKALNNISRTKNLYDEKAMESNEISKHYQKTLNQNGLIDIDDLILLPVELLRNKERAKPVAGRLKYIMIDEYQDINPVQYQLIKRLSGFTPNICAVGDSDQAIYAFRGADVENFLNFEKDFLGAKKVILQENFRSSRVIVGASQSLIKNNKKRIENHIFASTNKDGVPVKVIATTDEREEAWAIVREVEKRMGAMSHYKLMNIRESYDYQEGTYRFSDFAVLYRTNTQVRAIKDAFMDAGIPFKVIGDERYGILKKIGDRIKVYLDNKKGDMTLQEILNDAFCIAEEDDLKGMKNQLVHAYKDIPIEEALHKIILELLLFSSSDAYDPRAEAVTLMTLHMSKGLEFRVVFIAGAEDGLIPYSATWSEKEDYDIEEERRLFYVGMTRAKEELFITYCLNRPSFNRQKNPLPSPFIKEIPKECIEHINSSVKDKNRKKPKQQRLF
ncbi:MAG TPA: ATP-dependent helicase [Syntrophorhabdaceae bacterium]|nr:ATP-dependent helicase [Syntrophorhabdaceae bacterium]